MRTMQPRPRRRRVRKHAMESSELHGCGWPYTPPWKRAKLRASITDMIRKPAPQTSMWPPLSRLKLPTQHSRSHATTRLTKPHRTLTRRRQALSRRLGKWALEWHSRDSVEQVGKGVGEECPTEEVRDQVVPVHKAPLWLRCNASTFPPALRQTISLRWGRRSRDWLARALT
jgi:hypothetical protein